MITKYAIQYNNDNGKTEKYKFDSIEEAEQNLLNNGYHLIENNIHQKIWATLDFSNNRFRIENIEIIEVQTYTSQEITEKILTSLSYGEYNTIFKDVSRCQNSINLKINNQMFRISVEEVAT